MSLTCKRPQIATAVLLVGHQWWEGGCMASKQAYNAMGLGQSPQQSIGTKPVVRGLAFEH